MRKLRGERNLSKSKASRQERLPVSALFDAAESESSGEALDNVARKEIARRLREERVSPDFIYAFEKTGKLVTDDNRDLWTAKALREWTRALGEYRRRVEGDSKSIDLCFSLHHETGRTDPAKEKRFAASEFAIAVLCAHDQGLSSFAVEELFSEAWLDYLLRHRRVPETAPDPTDHQRFDRIDFGSIAKLLYEIYETLPDRAWSTSIEKRIARIEAARAEPDTWLGKSPDLLNKEEPEEILTIDDLQNAISQCELEGVTPDLIESMLLRSWIRMLVVNEHAEERFFQILDKNWDEVHARVQVHMGRYSGLRLQ
jgi:hypothetical protein